MKNIFQSMARNATLRSMKTKMGIKKIVRDAVNLVVWNKLRYSQKENQSLQENNNSHITI